MEGWEGRRRVRLNSRSSLFDGVQEMNQPEFLVIPLLFP